MVTLLAPAPPTPEVGEPIRRMSPETLGFLPNEIVPLEPILTVLVALDELGTPRFGSYPADALFLALIEFNPTKFGTAGAMLTIETAEMSQVLRPRALAKTS